MTSVYHHRSLEQSSPGYGVLILGPCCFTSCTAPSPYPSVYPLGVQQVQCLLLQVHQEPASGYFFLPLSPAGLPSTTPASSAFPCFFPPLSLFLLHTILRYGTAVAPGSISASDGPRLGTHPHTANCSLMQSHEAVILSPGYVAESPAVGLLELCTIRGFPQALDIAIARDSLRDCCTYDWHVIGVLTWLKPQRP